MSELCCDSLYHRVDTKTLVCRYCGARFDAIADVDWRERALAAEAHRDSLIGDCQRMIDILRQRAGETAFQAAERLTAERDQLKRDLAEACELIVVAVMGGDAGAVLARSAALREKTK